MIVFRIFLYAYLAVLIILVTINYFAFRKNIELVAKQLGFSEQVSKKGIVYEGYFDGRKVEIGRQDRGLGLFTKSNSRVILKSSITLSSPVELKVVLRRFFENVLSVEGENVSIEQLFELEGEPKHLFISCVEEQRDLKTKIIDCIQTIGSGGQLFLEIKSDEVSLEHGRFRLQPEQIISLLNTLNSIAASLESQDTQTTKTLHA